MNNTYQIKEDRTTLIIVCRDKRQFGIIFDTKELPLVQLYHWRMAKQRGKYYYAIGSRLRPDGVTESVPLHRLIAYQHNKESLVEPLIVPRDDGRYCDGRHRKNASETGYRNIYFSGLKKNPYCVSVRGKEGKWTKKNVRSIDDAILLRDKNAHQHISHQQT